MEKIDKSLILTDSVIDNLLDDWFERDGETFLRIRKTSRIGWESTLEEGDSYSAYFLEAPTQEDLIKRAYTLAKETLVVMDSPFKVNVKITTGLGGSSYTEGKTVCVNTAMFDDPELSVGEKLDTFLGVTIHEGCHLLYTDFSELTKITNKVIHQIFNILEDERVEELCSEHKPGLANFLAKSKYYYFDQYYLDYVVPKEKESGLTPFDRIMNCFLHIIRYPRYLKEEEIIEFAHYLLEIKKVVLPYPKTTSDAVKAAYLVFDIIKEFYEDIEGEEGSSDTDKSERAMHRLLSDAESASDALDKIAGKPVSVTVGRGLTEKDLSHSVARDSELLGELCEGSVELGSSDSSFFIKKSEESPSAYKDSVSRIKRYIPSVSKILRGHCREYRLVHRSMRSGILDTNKLSEAFQGVPTVYLREGRVKTDKVAVCVLIDESGSMSGRRIESARDAAILINEAIGSLPNVELFIYGHSGDIKRSISTEIFIYREKGYTPKFSLGSVKALSENRDGVAILETAKRVRSQTSNPCLFFILSDGAPSARDYSGKSAIDHVKDCVVKAERLGFCVIQVCINHSYDPGLMFKNYIIMDNMNTLASELSKAIKKAIMRASKVSIV